jgi:hypothetical protein
LTAWSRRDCRQANGYDRMLGRKGLEMRFEHPEKHLHVSRRLRNFKMPLVVRFVRKRNYQRQFFGDEIMCAEPLLQLLEKTPQHEEQRLARLDFMLEVEMFCERFARLHQLQGATRFTGGAFPHAHAFGAEPRRDILFSKRGEIA